MLVFIFDLKLYLLLLHFASNILDKLKGFNIHNLINFLSYSNSVFLSLTHY